MQTSENGYNLIKQFESFRNFAYQDVAGIWTIAWGHKLLPGESYPQGVTEGQGDDLLQRDAQTAEAAVNRLMDPSCNQNQFDALVDFAFNLGTGSLQMMLSHGWNQVPEQVMRWNHAGGKVVDGLTRRRQAEVDLFNTPMA